MRPRARRWRPWAGDAGMVTAEIAVALPALVLAGLLATVGVQVALAQVRCLQAASVAARLLARGESAQTVSSAVMATAPAGARLVVHRDGTFVAAEVAVDVRVPVMAAVLPAFPVRQHVEQVDETGPSPARP